MATNKKEIKTVAEYLATLDPQQRPHLEKLRKQILESSTKLEEGLTYSTPAYRAEGKLVVGLASAKAHTGFYVMSETVMAELTKELKDYELAKTSFKIPFDKSVPSTLIKRIIAARLAENEAESIKKKK